MDIFDVRQQNFIEVVKQYGSLLNVAEVMDLPVEFIEQLASGMRKIGNGTARKLEQGLGITEGRLDDASDLETSADKTQVGGSHYLEMKVEPWTVIDSWSSTQRVGFYKGNALKYIMRAGNKGDVLEDLKKARHYIDKLIEVYGE